MNVRWNSPFPYTLAFNLFKQHFNEINRSYWAFVPVANTIKKYAKDELVKDNADPKTFFLIPDEEDRRIALTYAEWKNDFSVYVNYSRLNMVMLLSSCFETYLRTVVSLAFESKPGVIVNCREAIDGACLIKKDITYGDVKDKNYRFANAIDEVCRGEWKNRFAAMQRYFGMLPQKLLELTSDLDELRVMRNNIGHYFGRKKTDYEAPIDFVPKETTLISHEKVLKCLNLVFSAAKQIDEYLQINIIGSYDIIKRYYIAISKGEIVEDGIDSNIEQLRKLVRSNDLARAPKSYFCELVTYCEINYNDNKTDCVFSRKISVQEINRRLRESEIKLYSDGEEISFDEKAFSALIKKENLCDKSSYMFKRVNRFNKQQEFYSSALIDYVYRKLESNPCTIMKGLKGAM